MQKAKSGTEGLMVLREKEGTVTQALSSLPDWLMSSKKGGEVDTWYPDGEYNSGHTTLLELPSRCLNLQWPRREVKFPGMDLGVIGMQEVVKTMREEEFSNRMIYTSLLIYNVVFGMHAFPPWQTGCVCVYTGCKDYMCKDSV